MMWLGLRPLIIFHKPETIEILLSNSVTISKSIEYDFLKPWIGTGLLTSTGEKWRKHRKLLTPTFHFQILENFVSVFNEEAAILAKKLELEVLKPWTDIVPMISMCTLDTICQTAMGVHLNIQKGRYKEYFDSISEISDIFIYRALRPWLWLDPLFFNIFPSGWKFRKNVKCIHDFTKKVIKEKKEYMLKQNAHQYYEENGKTRKKALLEFLLEYHLKDESFTEENIQEEVDTFMFEGHDTTAMSLSRTLHVLGLHPEIQEKLFQELDDIFQSDYKRPITNEDLKQMRYLECVIKESLRLFPSVPFIARQLTENLQIGNYTLTPGCTCLVFIYGVHRDPEVFPEPEIFNPDRFLPENTNKRHPYAFIPFSAGPRNCIGQRFALLEQKIILAYILRKFELISLDPYDKVQAMAGVILKNAKPIRVRFATRKLNLD